MPKIFATAVNQAPWSKTEVPQHTAVANIFAWQIRACFMFRSRDCGWIYFLDRETVGIATFTSQMGTKSIKVSLMMPTIL